MSTPVPSDPIFCNISAFAETDSISKGNRLVLLGTQSCLRKEEKVIGYTEV